MDSLQGEMIMQILYVVTQLVGSQALIIYLFCYISRINNNQSFEISKFYVIDEAPIKHTKILNSKQQNNILWF